MNSAIQFCKRAQSCYIFVSIWQWWFGFVPNSHSPFQSVKNNNNAYEVDNKIYWIINPFMKCPYHNYDVTSILNSLCDIMGNCLCSSKCSLWKWNGNSSEIHLTIVCYIYLWHLALLWLIWFTMIKIMRFCLERLWLINPRTHFGMALHCVDYMNKQQLIQSNERRWKYLRRILNIIVCITIYFACNEMKRNSY